MDFHRFSFQYERAELYYRLVNAQDGDDQSHAPLSPSFRDLYIYPLQVRKCFCCPRRENF